MTGKRKIIYALLALAIAFLAHQLWYTVLNPLVWDLTYIGARLARAIHQPDYDSVLSTRVFDGIAIIINALVYFAVLVAGDYSRARVRKRSMRGSAAISKN